MEAEMTAARLLKALAVGLLLLNGSCAEEPSSGGGAGTVVFGSPAGFEILKAGVPGRNLQATLSVDGGTASSMSVNQDTGVPSLSLDLPPGAHTFVIRYLVPDQRVTGGLLLLGEATGTATINANVQNQPVNDFSLNTSGPGFDFDGDNFSNLTELRANTDPTSNASRPVGASALSVGGSSNCAVMGDSTVRCWGSNETFGQVGDNTTAANRLTPVTVVSETGTGQLTDVRSVAVGATHACALMNDGTARCWGSNNGGKLGNTTPTNPYPRPVQVQSLTNISALAASFHTCAIVGNPGTVFCWGTNDRGQVGNGTTNSTAVPQNTGITNATAIALGGEHTCARLNDGTVRCWGRNDFGQLGVGDTANKLSPTIVVSTTGAGTLSGVIGIAAGAHHSCAVLTDTNLRCWGRNQNGQLNNNQVGAFSSIPVGSGLNGTKELLLGGADDNGHYTCALLSSGTIRCVGANEVGQLGNGTFAPSPLGDVSTITNGDSFGVVGSGKGHACVLLATSGIRCWGRGDKGQLGNNSTQSSNVPVQVTGFQ
jgi:alpha-tubulin suppressor-like RCC1 family protein